MQQTETTRDCSVGLDVTNSLDQALSRHNSRALIGLSVYSYDATFVELMSYIGYDALWIEMEHSAMTFAEAADLCRIASGLGLLTMIRIPDVRRENVLKAVELAPDIVDVPMVNTPESAAELVRHARFTPKGERGFFAVSRAMQYGVGGDIRAAQLAANERLCLMIQIETIEAVNRAEELCEVEGIDGVFLGPGDLSVSLGVPGNVQHPAVLAALERTISIARTKGKRLAIACPATDALRWVEMGVSLLFCGGSIACQRAGAEAILKAASAARGSVGGQR